MSLRLWLRRLHNRVWPQHFRRFVRVGKERVELGKEEK